MNAIAFKQTCAPLLQFLIKIFNLLSLSLAITLRTMGVVDKNLNLLSIAEYVRCRDEKNQRAGIATDLQHTFR